jgi:transposase
MRRLLVLCIVSFSLAGGCAREETPEGDGSKEEKSESVSHPLDVSPTAPVRTGYAIETRVRGEIDQMEGRRRFWDNRVVLSALSVSVHEPVSTVGGGRGGASSVLRKAFADSANNFVRAMVRRYPRGDLHVILDNSSTHSTPAVDAWLAAHPRVQFHFTPTGASWLNLVEVWFSLLTRKSVRRGSFDTVKALVTHIGRYIETWNDHPTPFVWTKEPADLIRKIVRRKH